MIRRVLLFLTLVSGATAVADSCAPDEILRPGRQPLNAALLAKVDLTAAAGEIVKQLGPAARDVGSGIHILEWDLTDGRVFTLSTWDFCKKPYAINFKKVPGRSLGSTAQTRTVAE